MSEPIPESIPTSNPHRARPPKKKVALTPAGQQSAQVEALFANPERAGNGIFVGPKPKVLAAPPEIIASVQGSSAGAGSGEFHVYKASRRREYERLRMMDEENQTEEADREFQQRKEEREREDALRLEKNRSKREKQKLRQQKKKLGAAGMTLGQEPDSEKSSKTDVAGGLKRKLVASNITGLARGESATPEPAAGRSDEELPGQEDVGITIHDDD